MRILIVEDEKRLAGTLAELLHRRGYAVDVSYDGVSGLDNARSGIYDLVLLDAMLPELDGFSLLQQLRAGGETVPVLMLTARSDLSDRVRGLDCGADYYLTKPFASPAVHVSAVLRRPVRPAEPSGVRPHGAADEKRQPDRIQGAADLKGMGLRLRRRG